MRGEVFASYSADKIIDQENADNYASEYLNIINLSSLPPHLLKLKVGAAVILLRNLSPSTGMCNGTRLRVVRISQRVIECEILAGKHAGNMVFIPRIPLASSSTADLPFDFQRTQFPLRLAFAMTIKHKVRHSNTLGFVLQSRYSPMDSYTSQYLASLTVQTCESSFQILLKHVAKER